MSEPYIVHGIAAVSTVGGKPYVDAQGDHIPTNELVRVAHEFVSSSRVGGIMHMRHADGSVVKAGKVVSSVVLTNALQKAMNIDLGFEPWIVGMQIDDPDVAKAIKSGQLSGFSIAGKGLRTPVTLEE